MKLFEKESNAYETKCDGCGKRTLCDPFTDQYGVEYIALCRSCKSGIIDGDRHVTINDPLQDDESIPF